MCRNLLHQGSRTSFQPEPAEFLQGGLCLLASAQPLTGWSECGEVRYNTMALLGEGVVSISATHVSESVPGSVLVVLSHGAQPFVVAVTGDRRLSAQQESHDRQQEDEHLLQADTDREEKQVR